MKKSVLIIIGIVIVISIFALSFVLDKINDKRNSLDYDNIANGNNANSGEKNEEQNPDEKYDVPVQEEKIPTEVKASVPIFMYHFVTDNVGNYEYPENMVSPSKLEEQIKYLSENNYDTIFVSDIYRIHKFEKPISLTFDDGYLDFYTNAYPLLKKYNVKSTLFVINDFVGQNGYCNVEQLKEMTNSGLVSIDAHTVTHRKLATLSITEITNELESSKKFILDNLGINSQVLCYPYGSYNQNVINVARQNFKYALAMDGGVYDTTKHDLYEIPRIYANRSMTLNAFISYASKSSVEVKYEEE